MKSHFIFFLFIATGIYPVGLKAQQNSSSLQKIVIIRHGEKPDRGDNLSCQGLSRSLKLVNALHKKIGIPDYVYVPAINTGKSTSTVRMYQTIVPFAVKYNLDINTKYDVKNAEELVKSIRKKNGTVLLVWEHKAVQNILRELGINNPPEWSDNDFDSMLVITFAQGKATLTKDKENIKPELSCPE
ncbi:MAG: histidine phosphatase family protein [Bacteroidota bacterium]|nr:histidine phosphatase family protein [Bacteroidota bacterium]